jgi:hypothetical protein
LIGRVESLLESGGGGNDSPVTTGDDLETGGDDRLLDITVEAPSSPVNLSLHGTFAEVVIMESRFMAEGRNVVPRFAGDTILVIGTTLDV